MLVGHDEDDSLLRRLRDGLHRDRVPASVLQEARAAFSRRRRSLIARITHDSREDAGGESGRVRLLAQSRAGSMRIELVRNNSWTLIVNSPNIAVATAEVETIHDTITAEVRTSDGSFRVGGITRGAFRVIVNAGTRDEIHTEWVTV